MNYRDEPPSRQISTPVFTGTDDLGRHWECEEYYGCLRKEGRMMVLGITATDETSRHDWREFQQLKNMLVGAEWEAAEMYPAESELLDPSNRFYLWCFRRGTLPFGFRGRRHVVAPEAAIAPQRRFPGKVPSTDLAFVERQVI